MERLPTLIQTERLVLRQWTENDGPAIAAAVEESIEHLRPWMGWFAEEPRSIEDRLRRIAEWREKWAEGGDSVLGVFLDGAAIGGTGLHRRLGPGALEIGYWIHAHHIRHGYATELSAALTDAAFGMVGIERVEIHHDKANVASSAIPRRLGFTLTEEVNRDPEAPGEIGIECRWTMPRESWMARSD
jgi:RimJ/RimL family protein N-acetyltransferase